MTRFVLLHGAWHGGWCFERVSEELAARGHDVFAPDLPCDRVGVTVQEYVDEVGPQPDAVVVGHVEARAGHVDGSLDVVQAAVKEVQLAGGGLDPGPAVYPAAPGVKIGHRGRLEGQALGKFLNHVYGEGSLVKIVDPYVQVGAGVVGAAGIRTAQHHCSHPGDGG